MYTQQTHYFLGANSPNEFYSLYDELIDLNTTDTLFILKGGSGNGVSAFLTKIADHMMSCGLKVEYIHSLENPSVLDAISIPDTKIAYVNGSAPHIIDAKFPGAVEQYIDLCSFYDTEKLKLRKLEIMEITRAYRALCIRAYGCIASAWSVIHDLGGHLLDSTVAARVHRRTKGIITREIPKGGGSAASIKKRFLTAITHEGYVARFDAVKSLASRVYLLDNNFGLSHLLISDVAQAASAAGHDIIICPSPLEPDRFEHLIIPSLSLAFVSRSHHSEYTGEHYRHIRLDAMVNGDRLKSYKARIRFSQRIYTTLIQEAANILSDAKKLYDELAAIYDPCTDLQGIDSLADAHIKILLDNVQ